MPYQAVHDFNLIDLSRHGLIEASAGTGKTYTIENLVVRLLKEREEVELEQVLLVTFTEKAASELKARIRKRIEEELEQSDERGEIGEKLRRSLDSFDKAPIHTIHGFCQTVLRDFAFENGVLFKNEVVDDGPLFETLLREQMRRDWPRVYGKDLDDLLHASGFHQNGGSFIETVAGLARSLHREAGNLLIPEPEEGGLDKLKEEIGRVCKTIGGLLGTGGEFTERYGRLNFDARSRKSILEKIVKPIEECFGAVAAEDFSIPSLLDLKARIEKARSAGRKGLESLIPSKWNKSGPNLEECPHLDKLKQALADLFALLNRLRFILPVQAVYRLQDDLERLKRAHGWISYHDMLSLVDRALSSHVSSQLLERLRNRYRVAFIDEFQDTDPLQWRIFRKIFVEGGGKGHGNLIFLIGDPKQAIYSFRGADVYAYLDARAGMERLEKEGRAGLYSLDVNWRSIPALIGAFNTLFTSEGWFKPLNRAGELEIGYQDTKPPPPGMGTGEIVQDHSERHALNIVDLRGPASPGPAKGLLAEFVVSEIRRLISSRIVIRDRGEGERKIDYGDICVLVRTRNDLPFMEEKMAAANIPYSFYRKPGLFLSDEAVYTALLFHAVLDPTDGSAVKKALLTPFFGLDAQSLYAYEETPPTHPVKELLFKWHGLAARRRWGRLFQSMVEESGLITREAPKAGWDRRYTNYRQIFEYLEEAAYRKNLDFRGLAGLLDTYRSRALKAEEDDDIHQIETDARKVQIMTMHVSKGLEFPVVFIAGGLTRQASHREKYHTYHLAGKGNASLMRKVFDLAKSDGEGRHEKENADEDKRLYYVAATRARFKLYLPFYLYDGGQGWLGPVCTLLSPALSQAFSGKRSGDVCWLQARDGSPSPGGPRDRAAESRDETVATGAALEMPGLNGAYLDRRMRLDSFSSLEREISHHDSSWTGMSYFQAGPGEREDDEAHFAGGPYAEEDEGDEVPGGIETGLMFHEILERIDYEVVLKAVCAGRDPALALVEDGDTRAIIERQMEAHLLDGRWRDPVCRIVANTLTCPLTPVTDLFLARIGKKDRLHEVEFYYALTTDPSARKTHPHRRSRERFIRGVVDLVFRMEGKFYVADWKSNIVQSGYDTESLEQSMTQSGYQLQYRLYSVAVLRWLKQALGSRFDASRDFGGVFYFYLRGMDPERGTGIYHMPAPGLGTLKELEGEVGAMVQVSGSPITGHGEES